MHDFMTTTAALLLLSLSQGIIPKTWKHAIVRPLLKKPHLDPSEPGNYRPISLLPLLGKIAEKHVNQALSQFLEENGGVAPHPNGFQTTT